ncbi:PhzF family phenazine biosynthesis protein [Arthrobacter globiformis]|uniref:PhzF family phenazine biosynthesis protein n=1 Tax=Arthrobacter globiformis TaxID=1665 RepID=UPI002789708A|nr:PhzF family phenazine biosynthesis protein [Arthrobacter globiformis]MDQ0866976.1 PhzF family phenazine biosynthesis protein [Arthrobacter globiformis]
MSATVNEYPFSQVDVFAPGPRPGNPVAVVHDADGLSTEQMQSFANWTNLSETTFLLKPTQPEADYRLRIFTPASEFPFAGHPTLGSAHAWLENGGQPQRPGELVQECEVGLVKISRTDGEQFFEAPPLLRSGAVEPEVLEQAIASLGITPEQVLDSNWVDNGPGWLGIRLASARQVLDLVPDFVAMGQLNVGVIGPYGNGGPADFEVRGFLPSLGIPEDSVTGSLNAGLAQWLIGSGAADANYTVSQGTVLGRGGRLTITGEGGSIWVGGTSRTVIRGSVFL